MSRTAQWALALGALVLAGIVALLPVLGREDGDATQRTADTDAAALAGARDAARLPDCPKPPGTAVVSQLRDVAATCLADGSRVDVGAALAGRTTLINLWATWCGPCREELPVLDAYADSDGAVDVLAVQVDSDQREGLELLAELDVRLPAVHDGEGRGPIRSALRAPPTLPASYLVTSDGQVRLIENPRVFSSVDQVRKAVGAYGGSS